MEPLWINGEYSTVADAKIGIEDRALLFGDGIYEVIAVYQGVPILLEEHLDRWERSAEGLKIQQSYSRSQRVEVLGELIRRLDSPRATLYGQLSRGFGRRAHQFPSAAKANEFWYARALPPYPKTFYTEGIGAITHPDERWARCWVKSTSLLANCLAKQAALDAGAFEAILYQPDGTVTEGAVANFHIVKNGAIHTHPLNGRILGGIKRQRTLELARQNGIPVHEEAYHLDFLRSCDEAFYTSTTINVLPCTRIDGEPVGDGKIGPVVRRLMELVESDVSRCIEVGIAV